jgi:hypothetical protein
MKKSDTLTVLAGLAITGLGWRFGGQQWGIPLAIAAVAAFLLVHIFWKENGPINAPTAQITDSFKQSLQNVGNPHIEVHYSPFPTLSASLPTIDPEARPYMGQPRVAAIGYKIDRWVEWHGDDEGIVLEVGNSAGNDGELVGTATDLVVSIEIYVPEAERSVLVSRAYWLGRLLNEVDLGPGDKCDVLIAVREQQWPAFSFYENGKQSAPIHLGRRSIPTIVIRPSPIRTVPAADGSLLLRIKLISLSSGKTLLTKVINPFQAT